MTIWAKSWFHNTGASLERIVLCYHRTSALKLNDLPYQWWFNPDRIGQETPWMTFHTHLLHPTASLCLHFFFCVFPVSEREGERVTLYPERVGSPPIPCDGNISIDHSKWRHVKLPRQLQASEAAPCAWGLAAGASGWSCVGWNPSRREEKPLSYCFEHESEIQSYR